MEKTNLLLDESIYAKSGMKFHLKELSYHNKN